MFSLSKKVALSFLVAASASLMVAAQVPALCCQTLQSFSANAYVWENECNTYVSDTSVLVASGCEEESCASYQHGFYDATCQSFMPCPSVAGPIGLNCTGTEIE